MLMSKVVLKNLFQKYATRQHPFVRREQPAAARGMFAFDEDACIQCGICAMRCPTSCITLNPEKGEWKRTVMACLYCGVCADVCPKKCITLTNVYRGPVTQEEFIVFKTRPKGVKKAKPEDDAAKSVAPEPKTASPEPAPEKAIQAEEAPAPEGDAQTASKKGKKKAAE